MDTDRSTDHLRGERDLGVLRVLRAEYGPGDRFEPHAHGHAYLCFPLRGGFAESSGTSERVCRPGSVIFRPAGERHATRFGAQGARCLIVEMDDRWMDGVAARGAVPGSRSAEVRGGRTRWLAHQLDEELRACDAASVLALEGLVLTALGEVSRAADAPPGARAPLWLQGVLERVRAEAGAPPALSLLARDAGVHPVHLAREFRRHVGCTVGEYLRRARIERACAALASSARTISSIAHEAGFADHSHFTRTFRRHTGTTPLAYRRAHRGR
ncbi:MAG TPA: AraC family transcriptional regulator [Longimicrobium sp.]|jgi:AraC family transcriptional regulator